MQTELEDFYSGALFKLAVRAFAKIDSRHSAAANFTAKLPRAEPSRGDPIRAGPTGRELRGGASQKALRPVARIEEGHDFVFQRIVDTAFPVKQSAAQDRDERRKAAKNTVRTRDHRSGVISAR